MRKYEKGKDYPIYLRKYKSLDANEELLVDVNELAKGYSYFQLSEGFQSVLTIGKWLMQLIHYLEEFIQLKLKI